VLVALTVFSLKLIPLVIPILILISRLRMIFMNSISLPYDILILINIVILILTPIVNMSFNVKLIMMSILIGFCHAQWE